MGITHAQSGNMEGLAKLVRELAGETPFLSPTAVAEIFRANYHTAYTLMTKGKIESYKVGGKWFTTAGNIVAFLKSNSTARTSLEALMQSLNPLDPEDYRFRQELDVYMAERTGQVAEKHSLKEAYAEEYVSSEVSALLNCDKILEA